MEPTDVPAAPESIDLPSGVRCRQCGYALRGLTAPRCPECGRPFDPPAIWAAHRRKARRPFDATAARLSRPPSWWATACATAAVLSLGWGAYLPAADVQPGLASLGLWAVAAAVFLLTVRDRWEVAFAYGPPPGPRHRLRGANWVVLPALLAAFALPTPVSPLRPVAFRLSRSHLDAMARRAMASGPALPDQWAGLYPAHCIRRTAYGVNFRIAGRYECGLDYTTTGQPGPHGGTPLGGGWYEFAGK